MCIRDRGFTYLGPVDGHDIKKLYKIFQEAKKIDHAVLVHVLTEKGKGYLPAEKMPSKFHGTGPFDIATGQQKSSGDKDTYTDVFAKVMYRMGKEEPKLVAITAAMKDGTGLTPFAKKYPDRFFDVGIAEEHAVTSVSYTHLDVYKRQSDGCASCSPIQKWKNRIWNLYAVSYTHLIRNTRVEDKRNSLLNEPFYMSVSKFCRITLGFTWD